MRRISYGKAIVRKATKAARRPSVKTGRVVPKLRRPRRKTLRIK